MSPPPFAEGVCFGNLVLAMGWLLGKARDAGGTPSIGAMMTRSALLAVYSLRDKIWEMQEGWGRI